MLSEFLLRENVRSGAGVKPVFYASQSDHTTSEKKKKTPSHPSPNSQNNSRQKTKKPQSSHTIPLIAGAERRKKTSSHAIPLR